MTDTALSPEQAARERHNHKRAVQERDIARARTLVIWCPDWPAMAALAEVGLSAHTAAAVLLSGRVQVTTAAARAEGVRTGMPQRDAQSRCPDLVLLRADGERDARRFEPVAAALEAIIPAIEVLRPGLLACRIRSLTRYIGSEDIAAERIIDVVESEGVDCRIGIAGSLPVAVLAAHRGVIVSSPTKGGTPAPGEIDDAPAPAIPDAAFCAELPIGELAADPAIAQPAWRELTDLLIRLGIRTAGAFAALPLEAVITRFGAAGVALHQLASGRPDRELSRRMIVTDISTYYDCEPPLERVDTAAFIARSLAGEFHGAIAGAGLACTRLAITATTGSGDRLQRVWRVIRPLTATDTADRLRWQLDGWLTHRAAAGPGDSDDADPHRYGIVRLQLEALEAVDAGQIQYGLWGSDGSHDERAAAAFARVQGLLGPDGVITAARSGGRGAADRIATAPFGEQIPIARDPIGPWPGSLLIPTPARALRGFVTPQGPGGAPQSAGRVVRLVDSRGHAVLLTDRGMLTGAPALVDDRPVRGWAGPWVLDEQWWADGTARRARMQITAEAVPPVLLELTDRGWCVEAVYD